MVKRSTSGKKAGPAERPEDLRSGLIEAYKDGFDQTILGRPPRSWFQITRRHASWAGRDHARNVLVERDESAEAYADLESGSRFFCADCGYPQSDSPSGKVCKNGHGGAASIGANEAAALRGKA